MMRKRPHEALPARSWRKVHGIVVRIASPVGRATSVGGTRGGCSLRSRGAVPRWHSSGEVVTHDDVGAGRVEVHKLRKIAAPSSSMYCAIRPRCRNDLERGIAAILSPVQSSGVVRDGTVLLTLPVPPENPGGRRSCGGPGILDASAGRYRRRREIERSAERPSEVGDSLPHDRILWEQGEEIRVDRRLSQRRPSRRRRAGGDEDRAPVLQVEAPEPVQEPQEGPSRAPSANSGPRMWRGTASSAASAGPRAWSPRSSR